MFKRVLGLLVVLLVGGSMSWAWAAPANAVFAGEWKLNPAKSRMFDQMKVKSVGENKYFFDFGGTAETIVVDGTFQPGVSGTTFSVTPEGPDSWKVVRKKGDRVLLTAFWKLSQDGKTLTDDFTSTNPNGSKSNVIFVYDRKAGGPGFDGTWVSTHQTMNPVPLLRIQAYDGDGLSLISSSEGTTTNVKFDGKEYPMQGPNGPLGLNSSVRQVDERTLELTDKVKDKVVQTRQLKLSSDSKTLSMTVHTPGQDEPNILVFERQ